MSDPIQFLIQKKARNHLRPNLSKIAIPEKLADEIYGEKWIRYGGHYEDTPDGEIFAQMLEPVASKEEMELFRYAGKMGMQDRVHDIEDEIESELTDMEERVEREARSPQRICPLFQLTNTRAHDMFQALRRRLTFGHGNMPACPTCVPVPAPKTIRPP